MAEAERIRVEVTRLGRWWCEIIAEGRNAEDAVEDLIKRLPTGEGFSTRVLREREASRIVEVGGGTRLLGRTFKPVA